MIRNHNVIMNNVKKFLKISSYEDENKILNFPFIKQNKNQKIQSKEIKEKKEKKEKNEKKEIIKSPPTVGFKFKRMKTIANSDKAEKNDVSFYSKDITSKNDKKSSRIINKNFRIKQQKFTTLKRHSTPNLRNKIRNANKIITNTSTNKFINIKNQKKNPKTQMLIISNNIKES